MLFTACATVPQEPVGNITDLSEHVTENGQRFSLAYMPNAGRVSVHVIWPNDFAHTSGLPAASTLGVELMSSGGAGDRTAKKIQQDITALGSSASLRASPDHIYGSFSSAPETLDQTVDIINDVLREPLLDDFRFDALRDAKRKRVESQLSERSSILWSAARRTLLGESTFTDYWNNNPVESTITSISIDNIKRWHRETFTTQEVTVAVAGAIDAATAAEVVDQLLDGLPVSKSADKPVLRRLNTGQTILIHDKSAPATLIAVLGLLPASRVGGEIADVVAVSAYGKGKDSRLLQATADELPESEKLDASLANFSRTVRVFGVNANVSHKSAPKAYRIIEDTYRKFKPGNLDDQEVLRAVVPFVNSLQSSQTNPDLLAYGLGQLLLDDLPQELLLTVSQDSISLKAEEVNQRITDMYPDWDDMVKVILTRDPKLIDADCVVRSLEEISDC